MVPPGFAGAGPNIVGATGGSGTRAVARILRHGGMFIGTHLNAAEDAVELGELLDVWINTLLAFRGARMPEWVSDVMRAHLQRVLRSHLEEARPQEKWGWKEPRSIFLLPFVDEVLPTLKFLHVVRDGRDMAFSANQNQLRKHGAVYLGRRTDPSSPVDSIALWAELNLATARYGLERMDDRYLRIRYEDLCSDPTSVSAEILTFFELDGDVEIAAREVRPGAGGPRRAQDPETQAQLERLADEALREFGYITD